jgi:hypothetical protein
VSDVKVIAAPWRAVVCGRVADLARARRRSGCAVTGAQCLDAAELACDWIEAAARVQVTEEDLDLVASVTITAVDAVLARDRRRSQR